MAELKREYVVPLRNEVNKVAYYKRANKAMSALVAFIKKHMKSDDVKVGRFLNEKIWENGIKNPPTRLTVEAVKDNEGTVTVELKETPKLREKVNKKLARTVKAAENASKAAEEEAKKKAEKKAQIQKDLEAKKAEKAAAKKAEAKAEEKKDTKETKEE